ncbi:hypothetical protein MesoLj131c_63720 [Mesorhizobium sp. 131-3-5]|uniref:hypothetical protein n=1 Tax=Mesorhizobium sp. 131-3-5 TaxID=2744520 RepID=UPI0019273FF4|nr:hypothetical protein [Mesorhizobium sp. 131-3-5]BCH12114.1 hypothetical protein MesoLj131c_63720 [Mesorhizobium sp. 131-3-5]
MNAPTLDDLQADAKHLRDLLDVICDRVFGKVDHNRDQAVDSMLWIARDLAEKMAATPGPN